ncbi:Ubiquinone biosynthesis protein COQ9, mitochondrial [Sesamum angolense]|uniref:Ubiquinone biosynthesis protein n=1 Tax=Sesamum angolense TaxID=2727404 RepID=A0AAE1WPF3_9LAMI|nr:Ubiquinone biosynthesis protein COQ9, mitochondrial [Sesamum angolense]
MYRSAARRLLPALCRRTGHYARQPSPIRCSAPIIHSAAFSASAASEKPQNHKPHQFGSSSSSSSSEGGKPRTTARPKAHWQEEQARVLQASLRHVIRLGWGEAAMIAGAREVGVSPSIVGSFPRKEAALVEVCIFTFVLVLLHSMCTSVNVHILLCHGVGPRFLGFLFSYTILFFMDDCLQRLIDIIDMKEDLKCLIPSQRVAKLVRIRLEMQAPYISKWPQALSIQAQPSNISTSFKQRAMLVDEIWHAAVMRPLIWIDFQDTWAFLDERVSDAFDLQKTVKEAKYLAEAVGAGMGGSVQGLVKRLFQVEYLEG